MKGWMRKKGDYTHRQLFCDHTTNSLYNYIHSHTLSKKQSRAQCTCMVNVSLSAVMLQNSSVKRKAGWAGATGKSGTLDTAMTRLPPRLSNMAQNIILAFWVNVNIIL